MQSQSERWRAQGFDFDMAGLVYFDDRTDVATFLSGRGWQTDVVSAEELLARHGLPVADADDAPFGAIDYLSAQLNEEGHDAQRQ